MQAVRTHGAPKITMNSREADYKQKLRQAQAQADGNQYVTGVQSIGDVVSDSRGKMGAPTVMPQELIEGPNSNFHQVGSTGNMPNNKPQMTTGNVDLETSATKITQKDPEDFQTEALDRRLNMYARAAGNAYAGMNDRSQIGRA